IYPNGHFYEDDFVRVGVTEHYRLMDLARMAGDKGVSRFLYENKLLSLYLSYNPTSSTPDTYYEKFRAIFHLLAHKTFFKSIFFKQLIDNCLECGWVDIEQEYFTALKNCKNSNGLFDYEKVNDLNRKFYFLKQKLEEYLTI